MELHTVIGSDLFSQDKYIEQYLLDPDSSLITKIKIGLRYYITAQPELILQLSVFKDYLEKVNPLLFLRVFGNHHKDSKKW
jgi:hypothetical protein